MVDWWVWHLRKSHLPLIFQIQLLGKKFVEELCVSSGKSCADALENNSLVNDCIVEWLWSTLLTKFTIVNLVLFVPYCVCWRSSGKNATFSKPSCIDCGFWAFMKGLSYFEMQTLSPILNLGSLIYRSGLQYRMDKKSEFFTFFGI